MFRKHALPAALALALAAGAAYAQFSKDMTLEQLQVEIKAQQAKNISLTDIVADALKAGVSAGDITLALLILDPPLDPASVIFAALTAGGGGATTTVIATALGANVDSAIVSAAAIKAGVPADQVATIMNGILGALSPFAPGRGATTTAAGTAGGGGGPGTTATTQ